MIDYLGDKSVFERIVKGEWIHKPLPPPQKSIIVTYDGHMFRDFRQRYNVNPQDRNCINIITNSHQFRDMLRGLRITNIIFYENCRQGRYWHEAQRLIRERIHAAPLAIAPPVIGGSLDLYAVEIGESEAIVNEFDIEIE